MIFFFIILLYNIASMSISVSIIELFVLGARFILHVAGSSGGITETEGT